MCQNRAVIFVNGELPDPDRAKAMLLPGDYLVAADNGVQHLLRMGLKPDLVMGDMDSVSDSILAFLQQENVQMESAPAEKDESDLELAIRFVLNRGYTTIVIVAALGGRIDHALSNISLLGMPELASCTVSLDDGQVEVCLIRKEAILSGRKGDLVSLIPHHGPAGNITTEGLYYPLNNESLLHYQTRGLSNLLVENQAHVTVGSGSLLCVHIRK